MNFLLLTARKKCLNKNFKKMIYNIQYILNFSFDTQLANRSGKKDYKSWDNKLKLILFQKTEHDTD